MAEESLDLDLIAGELRADARDLPAFFNALATWFEGSLPHLTKVERKRAGLRDKRKLVVRIEVTVGAESYMLESQNGAAYARRAKTVRGVVLKSEELPVDEWLRRVMQSLAEEVKISATSLEALRQIVV